MTAEIAVMNREAVALASDSAATSVTRGKHKIFTSANKLFSLSKYNPVGVMIYGNASLLGVPWELLVKSYRDQLSTARLDRLEDYAEGFARFIDGSMHLFPESAQDDSFMGAILGYFKFVRGQIHEQLQYMLETQGSVSDTDIARITKDTIKRHEQRLLKAHAVPTASEAYHAHVMGKFGTFIDKASTEVFKELPRLRSKKPFRTIACCLAYKFPKGLEHRSASGVVIAGFGKDDYYPAVIPLTIERVVCNKLKYKIDQVVRVGVDADASVFAFAQREAVTAFMNGIDPDLLLTQESYLEEVFSKCLERVTTELQELDAAQQAAVTTILARISKQEVQNYRKKLRLFREAEYEDPIMEVVARLPKDELAAVAETLVNLTSFKRKVSMELETVGGPVDVAVISKGDGFVWIKRKHYFEPRLNPQFFANYNREVQDGKA